ncbi:hypothetical protein AVEN_133427-1 [Araneus ventricosus]|uniref:Uncharacterized protein n=1 Tax=Araneus ventricosus TaxID=182803 RepID=A0A4Y2VCK8_ARAVE|nr:hypothetical protein AVEN_133427-1 [Araneus ventricosus]
MNSRRFPSPRKPLWKLRFTTQTPSLTLARPKIRLARIEPTKPAGAGVVVRVLKPSPFLVLSCWLQRWEHDCADLYSAHSSGTLSILITGLIPPLC